MKARIAALGLVAALLCVAHPATAQVTANVVSSCGTTNGAAYDVGQNRPVTQDTTGKVCDTGGGGGGTVTANQGTAGSSPWPVVTALPATTTNSSSSITVGGTFQTIASSSASRKSIEFQNICSTSGNCTATTNRCWLFFAASGSPTTANSLLVQPGQEYLRSTGSIPSDAISATCDGTGDKYYLAVQ